MLFRQKLSVFTHLKLVALMRLNTASLVCVKWRTLSYARARRIITMIYWTLAGMRNIGSQTMHLSV